MSKNLIVLLISALLLFFGCSRKEKTDVSDVLKKVYSVNNLEKQIFLIDNAKDNSIKGKEGTRIHFQKNTFVDKNGKIIKGKVDIELKEALTQIDRIMGNLITTYRGKPLETGGMIYLNAMSDNKQLVIASDKTIQVSIPTLAVQKDSTNNPLLRGMSLFEGKQDSTGISWENPVEIYNNSSPIRYTYSPFIMEDDSINHFMSDSIFFEVEKIRTGERILKTASDSTFKIGKHTITINPYFSKGENNFNVDPTTEYIFSINKLGWANIDRLLADPRTKEVDFITSIDNQNEFKGVYISMITPTMYLPGYQRKDDTYCFSHGDDEEMNLPVGETVIILATAYKNEQPYFAMKKIIISERQSLSMSLVGTTKEKLKQDLLSNIHANPGF